MLCKFIKINSAFDLEDAYEATGSKYLLAFTFKFLNA